MDLDDERKSMLANAMPPSIYSTEPMPDRRPSNFSNFSNLSGSQRLSSASTSLSARLSTPPIDIPVSFPSTSPSTPVSRSPLAPPTRRPSEPTFRYSISPTSASPTAPAPVLRPRFSTQGSQTVSHYQENAVWTNPTPQFRPTNVDVLKQEGQRNAVQSPRFSRGFFLNATRFRTPWRPGKWKQFPWKGFSALFLAAALNACSTIIVLVGDGKAPDEWKLGGQIVQPQVWLSVLEMVTSFCIVCALAEGVAITFWRTMLQGSTITKIHRISESSHLCSALGNVFQLRFNMVATSTILTTMSFARGPFFQRALVLTTTTAISPSTSTSSTNPTTTETTLSSSPPTYHLQTTFLALSLAFSALSLLSILPLYHNYWSLGRPASLHPLEIARAFGAPLFDGLDGNIKANDIEAERGNTSVRYGVVERYSGEKVLRVEDVGVVRVRGPREDEILG